MNNENVPDERNKTDNVKIGLYSFFSVFLILFPVLILSYLFVGYGVSSLSLFVREGYMFEGLHELQSFYASLSAVVFFLTIFSVGEALTFAYLKQKKYRAATIIQGIFLVATFILSSHGGISSVFLFPLYFFSPWTWIAFIGWLPWAALFVGIIIGLCYLIDLITIKFRLGIIILAILAWLIGGGIVAHDLSIVNSFQFHRYDSVARFEITDKVNEIQTEEVEKSISSGLPLNSNDVAVKISARSYAELDPCGSLIIPLITRECKSVLTASIGQWTSSQTIDNYNRGKDSIVKMEDITIGTGEQITLSSTVTVCKTYAPPSSLSEQPSLLETINIGQKIQNEPYYGSRLYDIVGIIGMRVGGTRNIYFKNYYYNDAGARLATYSTDLLKLSTFDASSTVSEAQCPTSLPKIPKPSPNASIDDSTGTVSHNKTVLGGGSVSIFVNGSKNPKSLKYGDNFVVSWIGKNVVSCASPGGYSESVGPGARDFISNQAYSPNYFTKNGFLPPVDKAKHLVIQRDPKIINDHMDIDIYCFGSENDLKDFVKDSIVVPLIN